MSAARLLISKDNEKRVLVIGSTGHSGVRSAEWTAKPVPNVPDHDVVVVNARNLATTLAAVPNDVWDVWLNGLQRVLISGGTVIVLSDIPKRISRPKRYPEFAHSDFWCPIDLNYKQEEGVSIKLINAHRFANYFARFDRWTFSYSIADLSQNLRREFNSAKVTWRITTDTFATNREGHLLGASHRVQIYYPIKDSNYSGTYVTYGQVPDETWGEYIVLPLIAALDEREAVNLVLEDLGIPQRTLPPKWVEQLPLKPSEPLKKHRQALMDQRSSLDADIADAERKIQTLEDFKLLVYGTGSELEDILKKALTHCGGQIVPRKYGEEEYILVFNGAEYLVEVKGIGKSIGMTELRQLVDYLLRYTDKTGKTTKGILFGNAWRALPVEARGKQDTPTFASNVIDMAAKQSIVLVDSTHFFAAFTRVLSGEMAGAKLLGQITDAIGLPAIG